MTDNNIYAEIDKLLVKLDAECPPEKRHAGELPIWSLWQGVKTSRPFSSSDSEKKYFIRDE